MGGRLRPENRGQEMRNRRPQAEELDRAVPYQETDALSPELRGRRALGYLPATINEHQGRSKPVNVDGAGARSGSAVDRRRGLLQQLTAGPVSRSGYLGTMDENRARLVVDALRERGVPAHLE